MKAESTIRRRIRALRQFIEHPDSDLVAVRVAQAVEDSLRWTLEDVRGWPDGVQDAQGMANLIRQERDEVPDAH